MLHVAAPSQTALEVRQLSPTLGVEILGFDLSKSLSDAFFDRIYEAFLRHQLLLFREQHLEPGDQVAFARRFGSVQVHVMNQYHADGYPEIYYLSNLGPDGKPSGKHPDRGTVHWHTDGSWARRTGQATLLYGLRSPPPAARRASPACTTRTMRWTRPRSSAWPRCARSTTSTSRAPAGTARTR